MIAQPPNLPLIVTIAASLLKLVLTTGEIYTALDLVAFGSLFTWAWESARFLCTDWCDRIQSSQFILITFQDAIAQTATITPATHWIDSAWDKRSGLSGKLRWSYRGDCRTASCCNGIRLATSGVCWES